MYGKTIFSPPKNAARQPTCEYSSAKGAGENNMQAWRRWAGFLLTVTLSILGVAPVNAQSTNVDWKLHGATATSEGAQATCFHEAKSVSTNADGNVKVWVKCLANKAMDTEKMDKAREDNLLKDAGIKFIGGYVPPYAKHMKIDNDNDKVLDVIIYEEMANSGNIPSKLKILWELNCEGRAGRTLTVRRFQDGQFKSSRKPGDWIDIAPDGIGATLLAMVCPSK
jgi:hypothetical protein